MGFWSCFSGSQPAPTVATAHPRPRPLHRVHTDNGIETTGRQAHCRTQFVPLRRRCRTSWTCTHTPPHFGLLKGAPYCTVFERAGHGGIHSLVVYVARRVRCWVHLTVVWKSCLAGQPFSAVFCQDALNSIADLVRWLDRGSLQASPQHPCPDHPKRIHKLALWMRRCSSLQRSHRSTLSGTHWQSSPVVVTEREQISTTGPLALCNWQKIYTISSWLPSSSYHGATS